MLIIGPSRSCDVDLTLKTQFGHLQLYTKNLLIQTYYIIIPNDLLHPFEYKKGGINHLMKENQMSFEVSEKYYV
jgi:hypothetical protein